MSQLTYKVVRIPLAAYPLLYWGPQKREAVDSTGNSTKWPKKKYGTAPCKYNAPLFSL